MKCKHEGSCGFEYCNLDQCIYYTKAVETNFGRIQDMSLEELAAFLTKHDVEQNRLRLLGHGVVATATQLAVLTETVHRTWLSWLRQPIGDDTHEHSGLLEE